MRPSYMTAIRSASAAISSSSVDTSSTAAPLLRSSTIVRCMNSIDPTSTPRVGWLAMSRRSGRDSSRATTTFCWLPPDSDDAGVWIDWVRMSNCATRSVAEESMTSRFSASPRENGGRS